MAFTDQPIRNLLVPFVALLAALWLRPILQRLPAPELAKLQLTSLNGTLHSNETCKIIHHPAGSLKYCEDLLHWKEAGVAIASCDQGRPEWNTVLGPLKNPDPRGRLFVYHLPENEPRAPIKQPQPWVYELELTGFPAGKDFHPLGLELHQLTENSARLFLVNHRRDRSVIEVFKLEFNSPAGSSSEDSKSQKLSLTWERTLAHALISTPNAIVALDSNSFLVTNDHYINRRAHPALHVLETWLALRGGSVVEVRFGDQPKENLNKTEVIDAAALNKTEVIDAAALNKTEVIDAAPLNKTEVIDAAALNKTEVIDVTEWENVEAWKTIDGIPFANGLALNPSRSTLVVACSITQTLWYYHQLKPIGSNQRLAFNPIGSRKLSFAPDNIHFDSPHRLIAAGHPHGLSLLKFSWHLEKGKPAGSSVAVVLHSDPDGPLNPHRTQVHNILVDDGEFFASSTSAIIIPQSTRLNKTDHPENKLIVTGLYQTGLLECDLSSE
ncbi:hypothetical protein PtA15_10A460 [Puccinia triticina]|uniref:Uncharacterized protein n=2 Tax=Puccinia triticina TaxID=208348 RepID=A0ABY7D251_9BASI|nr:uncharacterized protein PtA15_10A460 [Puccinia triticina]WAQ89037.1 hypothetical protein PtA15_10A460 [Puccinia triticina]